MRRSLTDRKPRVYCHDNPRNQQIVASLPQLRQPFHPTPWLPSRHAQLIFHNSRKKKFKIESIYDHRETLSMSDGGETALVWRGYHLSATTPTILVLHTLTGSPESMAELVQDLHATTGWRVVLCLRRGHGDLRLLTPRFNILGSPDDLREQLVTIQARFPASPLYAIGSSAGSGLLTRYLGEEGAAAPFRAAFAYCPGYDSEEGFDKVQPFYSRYMANKLKRRFLMPHAQTIAHLPSIERLKRVENLAGFYRNIHELAGYRSHADYAAASNPMPVFERIAIPLMLLNAEDDPVCRIDNIAPWLEGICEMPNVILVTTAAGSHCAHYQGWRAHSWSGRLIGNYFKVLHQLSAS